MLTVYIMVFYALVISLYSYIIIKLYCIFQYLYVHSVLFVYKIYNVIHTNTPLHDMNRFVLWPYYTVQVRYRLTCVQSFG